MGTNKSWSMTGLRGTAPLVALAITLPAAGPIAPRESWEIAESEKPYAELLGDLEGGIDAEGMGLVTQAGPTEAARSRDVEIPATGCSASSATISRSGLSARAQRR